MKIERVRLIHSYTPKSLEVKKKILIKLNKYGLKEDNIKPQLVIAIGGDGTFLKALNKTKYNSDILYVGINTGHLGFLQQINEFQIDELFKKIDNNTYTVEYLQTQDITITLEENKLLYKSLNEIIIREQNLKTIELKLNIDNNYLQEFKGDGLMISTPIGSTAHNMSYGGGIIFPQLDALQILPLAPLPKTKYFSSINNNIIIPKGIGIEIEPNNYFKKNLLVNIDGESYHINFKVDKIEINLSEKGIQVLKIKDTNFVDKLNKKFVKLY